MPEIVGLLGDAQLRIAPFQNKLAPGTAAVLTALGREEGLLGEIFTGAVSRISVMAKKKR